MSLGGGKGGVGKTFLSSNLSAVLARSGKRVVAIDTDLEGANLHTWLGVAPPARSLADYVAGRETDVQGLPVETPIPGLKLITGTHGHLSMPQPDAETRARLLADLRGLNCDVVLIDCGAGAHPATVDYFLAGDDALIVLHPEPTSIENGYSFLRAAFYRRMELVMRKGDVRSLVREAMDQRNALGIRTPHDLLREVEAMDPEEGRRFREEMGGFRPRIVVNEVASAEDVKLGFQVRMVCRRFFGMDAEYTGYVNRDEAVREAVNLRRPVTDIRPQSDAAVYVRRIARKLLEAMP